MEIALIDSHLSALPLRTAKKRVKRIFEIDLLRGILILLMVVDHIAYDIGILAPSLFAMSGAPQALQDLSTWCYNYWFEAWRINLRYGVIALFFILSGISTYLSRNSLKRGMLILGFGAIISSFSYLASMIFETDMFIFFGIISCLGLAMIIYSCFRQFIIITTGSKIIWRYVSLYLALLFIGVGYWMRIEAATRDIDAQNWWLLINGRLTSMIPSHRVVNGIFTPIRYGFGTKVDIILGRLWFGVDWAGLFPYLGYAFLGGFLGELLYSKKKSLLLYKSSPVATGVEKALRPLTFIGSKTIYIYLLHQFVLALLTFIVFLIFGVPLK